MANVGVSVCVCGFFFIIIIPYVMKHTVTVCHMW